MKQLKFPQTFKVHDFEQLLFLSGIYTGLNKEAATDVRFKTDWLTPCDWTEESR